MESSVLQCPANVQRDGAFPPSRHFRYPGSVRSVDQVGLGELADELAKVEDWSARLSLGEQQGIVFARILLTKPKHLFLDEATSALDETAETHLLGLLRTKSWRPTIVSVGHGAALRQFHEQTLDLCRFEPAKEAVVAQSNCRPSAS
jgi:ABC-type uncharacterized transport system fused permease/ATPase subunit